MDKIPFVNENGDEEEYYIIEETRIGGINYLLVTEDLDEDDEAEAFIMKDISLERDSEAVYEFIEDDYELQAVGKVFEELLEDEIDLDM